VAENFGKILKVPLSYIERELEESPNDEGVLNEIKHISNKSTEVNIIRRDIRFVLFKE
jgi:hypothetical protein